MLIASCFNCEENITKTDSGEIDPDTLKEIMVWVHLDNGEVYCEPPKTAYPAPGTITEEDPNDHDL